MSTSMNRVSVYVKAGETIDMNFSVCIETMGAETDATIKIKELGKPALVRGMFLD